MNKQFLLFALLSAATACRRETDIQPNAPTLGEEVAGTYQTNAYLDPGCVALSDGQMPSIELKAESDSTVTLIYTQRHPARSSQRIPNVALNRQAEVIYLRVADSSIGSWQTDRIFINNGMEKQGKLLRISRQNGPQPPFSFTGFK